MKSTSLLIAALIALIVLVASSFTLAEVPPDPGLDGANGDVGVSNEVNTEVNTDEVAQLNSAHPSSSPSMSGESITTATIPGAAQASRLQPQEATVPDSNPVDLRPQLGDTVLYQAGHDSGGVMLRPAIVVEDWREMTADDPGHPYPEEGTVNLQVFLDGLNDFDSEFRVDERQRGLAWRTSVPKGEPGQASTWLPKA